MVTFGVELCQIEERLGQRQAVAETPERGAAVLARLEPAQDQLCVRRIAVGGQPYAHAEAAVAQDLEPASYGVPDAALRESVGPLHGGRRYQRLVPSPRCGVTVRFVHIGKTGGSSIRAALKKNGLAARSEEKIQHVPHTPFGPIRLPKAHGFRVPDIPAGDHTFFCVRDPLARFVSGFYSRLRKGQPRYYREWRPVERETFEAFPTPNRLAAALVSDDEEERGRGHKAMSTIFHLRPMEHWTGTPEELGERADQILYIGRQETLSADWEQLKAILELPPEIELPTDPVVAHRRDRSDDEPLDDASIEILRDWYSRDYAVVEYCEQVRAERGWGVPQGQRSPA